MGGFGCCENRENGALGVESCSRINLKAVERMAKERLDRSLLERVALA